ncbi:MAG: phage tail protein [Clostridia bacterium]|nr:phage tail protein [Clostridia bacterium]
MTIRLYSSSSTAEEASFENVNPVDALLGDEGVIAKYGGELQRDWFDAYVVERVGKDTNVQIRQGKNLLGISYDEDLSKVVTRIMPTGQDKDGEVLYLPELFLDSPNIGAYPHPKWIHLPVSDAKESEDKDEPKTKEQCYTEMRAETQKQFDAGCDLPTVTLTVSFINCPDTEEYKPYGFLQNIYLGDAVRVLAPRIGVMVSMRMTQYTYDCLLKKYTSMTLGTVADTVESNVISARQLPSGVITGSKLAINSVGTGQLQSGSVSSAQIQMAAIETAHIQDAAITRAKVGEAAIGEAQIEDAAIGTAKIQDAAVGRAKIAEGAIGTAQIDDAAITRAKIGDAAIGSAQIEEGSIGTAHIGQGAIEEANIHDAAITSAKIGEGEIKRAHIEDGAVDKAKIADASIDNAKIDGAAIGTANIQEGAIVTAHILDGQVTKAKIADLAVDSAIIADLAVTTAKIAQAAITNAQIANAAVDTAQIALGAITAALIAQGAVGTAQIADASITDAKIVSLNADVITSGTLATERLIIRGDNGLIYEINAQASGLSMQELQDEKYREQLSGTVLVARSVTAEQIAAATITANEILSGTITGNKIAAATIEGSNIKAGAISTSHVTADFGKTLDLSSNEGINMKVEKVYTDMDDLVGFRIEIISTSDILSEDIQQTTLTARVWHGSQNVTESIPAARFQWKRKSADSTADAIWNGAHAGMKSILLTTRDVLYSATYDCELLKE